MAWASISLNKLMSRKTERELFKPDPATLDIGYRAVVIDKPDTIPDELKHIVLISRGRDARTWYILEGLASNLVVNKRLYTGLDWKSSNQTNGLISLKSGLKEVKGLLKTLEWDYRQRGIEIVMGFAASFSTDQAGVRKAIYKTNDIGIWRNAATPDDRPFNLCRLSNNELLI